MMIFLDFSLRWVNFRFIFNKNTICNGHTEIAVEREFATWESSSYVQELSVCVCGSEVERPALK